MTQQWIAAAMTSGAIIGDPDGFQPEYPLRRTLSNYDTATGTYYLDNAPTDWPATIKAGATVLAMFDDDDTQRGIQWAGYITRTEPDTATDTVGLSLCTIEGYLGRRYAGDLEYLVADGWTVSSIVQDLVARYVVDGAGGLPGIPLTVQVVGTSPTITSDITWDNTDNASVFSRIQTLLGQYGGEFTIEWAWSPDGVSITPTLFVGPKIGTASTDGRPGVTFEVGAAISSISMPTDYGDGSGANHVTAYSAGQGSGTPFSTPVVATNFDGRPTFEFRFSPATTESDDDALDQHAQQAFAVLAPGAQPLSLTLADDALGNGQRLGTDWRMGDEIGYKADPEPAFPQGLDGIGRVIAIERTDPSTTTPIFAQPETYQGAS